MCFRRFPGNSEEIFLLPCKFSHFQGECFEAFYCTAKIYFLCIKDCGLPLLLPLVLVLVVDVVVDVVGVGC